VYALLAAVFVGTMYRMNVAYEGIVENSLCKLAGKTPNTLTDQEKNQVQCFGVKLVHPADR